MANKRKNRKRYNKGTRQDYTQGGRVQAQEGGIQNGNLTSAQKRSQAIALNRGRGREDFGRGRDEFDEINRGRPDGPPGRTPAPTPAQHQHLPQHLPQLQHLHLYRRMKQKNKETQG